MERTPGRFRLATFNLYNLGHEDYPDPADYALKLQRLAEVIDNLQPDVCAVQEVREPGCLEELAAKLPGLGYRFLADAPLEERRIQNGFLFRSEPLALGQWHDYPSIAPGAGEVSRRRFRRPVPWARVGFGSDRTLLAVGVHLKSRRPEAECVPEAEPALARAVLGRTLPVLTRAMEAAGLRCLLDEQVAAGAADCYAVLGDFNDGPESEAVWLAQGTDESRSGADPGPERLLVPALAARPGEGEFFSYCGSAGCELIDHILVSRSLATGLVQAGVESRLLVTEGASGSDHAPVWAEFEVQNTGDRKQNTG